MLLIQTNNPRRKSFTVMWMAKSSYSLARPRFFALFIQKHTKAPNICFRHEKSIKNADLNIPCCIEINDHVSLFPQIPGRSSFMGASRLKRTPLKSFQCTKLMAIKHQQLLRNSSVGNCCWLITSSPIMQQRILLKKDIFNVPCLA